MNKFPPPPPRPTQKQADAPFLDACILAALPAVLGQAACRGDWDNVNVARATVDLAEAVVAERNRRRAAE